MVPDPKTTRNPWDDRFWNISQQGFFLREFGRDLAEQWAKAAGTYVGGPRPKQKAMQGPQGPQGRRGPPGEDAAPDTNDLTLGLPLGLF